MKLLIRILFAILLTKGGQDIFCQKPNPRKDVDHSKIPVGMDSYRMWDKWPMQRIGIRTYMRSTYDRRGGNEGADASHFLFSDNDTNNISLDVKGKGAMYFFRANHWHGSPWRFTVDGRENIIRETGTLDPENALKSIKNSEFIPSAAFPQPLNFTWATTKGADLIWSPVLFRESMRIAYSKTHYGTGYYIYQLFSDESRLSQPLTIWNIDKIPEQDVLDLINRAGTDVAPQNISKIHGEKKLNKERILIASISAPESEIRAVKFSIPMDKALDLERTRIIITWDDLQYPSVDAPLSLFFGAGTFYNRNNKEYLVKAFPVNIRYDFQKGIVELGCYFPMPFLRSAKIELAGIVPDNSRIGYEVRYEKLADGFNLTSYFHATYKDIPSPEPGKDMTFLDTKGTEGRDDWSGNFVGTSFIFSHRAVLNTLEGDPRFFLDDNQTPNYGTGTEEWGGGGDYWGGENMTLPFAGHPCGARNAKEAKNEKDLIQSAYRFLLADLMPFGRRAVIKFEHGGENLSTEHYESVTYWYGLPSASLVMTDHLDVGNTVSENEHQYSSPESGATGDIISRYEWGIDVFPDKKADEIPGYKNLVGKEVFPTQKKDGRFTRGASQFIIKIRPENKGVLLRRTLDYSFPNQTGEVFVAEYNEGTPASETEWKYAGIWYTAGSNTLIYSNPGKEKDSRQLNIQISNRRFRDDEFLIPSGLTENLSCIRVKIRSVPDNRELFPGTPFPKDNAWSELDYQVYSYIIPE
jgi:hypothetical protein